MPHLLFVKKIHLNFHIYHSVVVYHYFGNSDRFPKNLLTIG